MPAPVPNTMISFVGCRVEITLDDDTMVAGKLLSFDKHQNVVVSDAERFRILKKQPDVKSRENVGLVFLRGKCVVSIAYKPGITTKAVVIDSRTDGRAAEARKWAAKRSASSQSAPPGTAK